MQFLIFIWGNIVSFFAYFILCKDGVQNSASARKSPSTVVGDGAVDDGTSSFNSPTSGGNVVGESAVGYGACTRNRPARRSTVVGEGAVGYGVDIINRPATIVSKYTIGDTYFFISTDCTII